jgi:hypothetical protein
MRQFTDQFTTDADEMLNGQRLSQEELINWRNA